MKTILVYDNNFYPELSSLSQLYTDLCTELVEDFNINVICAVPSYMGDIDEAYLRKWLFIERFKGINIYRVKVRPFNKKNKFSRSISIVSYFVRALHATLKVRKVDVILAVSQPPIIGGLLGVAGKIIKNCSMIYNIQDFNPEQIVAVGYSRNKLLLTILLVLDKISCRFADKIIVVSEEMINTIAVRFKRKQEVLKSVFINNWVDEKKLYPLEKDNIDVLKFKDKYNLVNKFIFMYSGNIGLIYDLENIIKVMKDFQKYKNIAFVFVGEGNMKKSYRIMPKGKK